MAGSSSSLAQLSMVDGALRSVDKVHSYITIGMEDIIEVSLDLAETAAEGNCHLPPYTPPINAQLCQMQNWTILNFCKR